MRDRSEPGGSAAPRSGVVGARWLDDPVVVRPPGLLAWLQRRRRPWWAWSSRARGLAGAIVAIAVVGLLLIVL